MGQPGVHGRTPSHGYEIQEGISMSLRINTNIDALTAYNALQSTQNSLSTSLQRLSTGLRINKAADDAAGLAISQGMTAEVNGLGQAIRNAQDGINFVQTADGALTETQSILQRMRTLAVQAANDTNSSASRTDIQAEVKQLNAELNRIASATNFNGVQMLAGSKSTTALNFQVGADAAIASGSSTHGAAVGTFNKITVVVTAGFTAKSLGTDAFGTTADAGGYGNYALKGHLGFSAWTSAISTIDKAIGNVSTFRATLGALQNRFQHTINNLTVEQQNLESSESSITDTDMASEMVNYTRANVLQQAGTAMLRQANSETSSVLSLLQ